MGSNEISTNPFEGEEEVDMKHEKSPSDSREISYHDIATKLLNDNLLLTALELHAELVEAGKEIPKLRVFFSNPGNFEQHTVAKPELFSPTIREFPNIALFILLLISIERILNVVIYF